MANFESIKNQLAKIYAPINRNVAEFKHTYKGVEYVVVATANTTVSNVYYWPSFASFSKKDKPVGTLAGGISPNLLKDVPVGFWGDAFVQIMEYIKPELDKTGGVGINFKKLPQYFPKTVSGTGYVILSLIENGQKRVVPHDPTYMDMTLMIMTVAGFNKYKAYIAQMQAILNKTFKALTNIKNRAEKLKKFVETNPNNPQNSSLRVLAMSLDATVNGYMNQLQKEDGFIIIAKKKTVTVSGIGVIPLVVWGIIALAGLCCVGMLTIGWYKDRKDAREKEQQKFMQLDADTRRIDDLWIENELDPNRTPEEKEAIRKRLQESDKTIDELKKTVIENGIDNQPGMLDKVQNIALILGASYVAAQFIGKRNNN